MFKNIKDMFWGPRYHNRTVNQSEMFVPAYQANSQHKSNVPVPFNSSNVIFNHMFNTSKLYWKETDLINPNEVIFWMTQMAEPLWGEFVEENDNEAFLDISEQFFKYLFFNGSVWIWYGPIGDLPIDQEDEEPLQEIEPGRDEFLLLIKLIPEDLRDPRYIDVKTKKLIVMPDEVEPIRVNWRGEENITLPLWYDVTYQWLVGRKIYENKRLLFGKTYGYTKTINEATTKTQTNLANLSSMDPHYINDNDSGKISELKFVDSMQLREYLLAEYQRLDRDLSELGRVANINDKFERKTTGENYKDIHSVACRQRLVINNLKSFAAKCLRKFGVDLSFAVNGVLNKEDLQTDKEGTPKTPNLGEDLIESE